MSIKKEKRIRRHRRIRAEIKGSASCPRLCVFKSLNHIYAQLINDDSGKTVLSAGDKEISKSKIKKEDKKYTAKSEKAFEVGKLIAKKAKEKKIEKVVFDRAGYKYHGRVKALAEGAREGGLIF